MALTPLSARLKFLRESRHLTQQDLGTYLNISRQGYSHYENGTRVPDFHVLERLADLYGLAIDDLLTPYAKDSLSGKIVEEEPAVYTQKELSRREHTLLNLFSQLSPEDKDDFLDLLSVKLQQHKIRESSKVRDSKKTKG